jgi:hypothetical protein
MQQIPLIGVQTPYGLPSLRRVIGLTDAASLVVVLDRNKSLFMTLKISKNMPDQRKCCTYCKCQSGACNLMLLYETEIIAECNEKEKREDTVKHDRIGHLWLHLKLPMLYRLPSCGKQLP